MIKLNEKEIAKSAKKLLKTYHDKKRRYIQMKPSPINSKLVTSAPRVKGKTNNELWESWIDYGVEIEEIERAVESIKIFEPIFYDMLKLRYIETKDDKGRCFYENEIGYSSSHYDRQMRKALIMFAESYHKGQIIKETMN
ncbi:hypothetical protein BG261_07710 [Floricoccus tropicus]|uniref:ArpU family transcriptional regulator n=1 Tax=Floricoccus tropicus TaxID=1859473 RepID=A0A1E8GIV1_9LACT|nr:hypothetical protein [Floricoccus tropicus]OFI48159.1 hypothetical protein BG261_07710 [Floricoccus tropicus]